MSNFNGFNPVFTIIDDPCVKLSDAEKDARRQALVEYYSSPFCPKPDAIVSCSTVSLPAPIEELLTPYCDKMLEDAARKGL